MDIFDCKVGDIFLLKKGRDDKLITSDKIGKIIIPVNNLKIGYAKITKILKRAERYTLVEMENVISDYYEGINYEEFLKVLKFNKFKIGFDRPFEYEDGIEHQILAYNLDNGIVIIAETFYQCKIFNSIDVYAPNVNMLTFTKCPMLSMISSTMAVFDLCRNHKFDFPLQKIMELIKDKKWNERENISLWTYADKEEETIKNTEYIGGSDLWKNTIDRILLADKDIEQILGNCKHLKQVFNKRK